MAFAKSAHPIAPFTSTFVLSTAPDLSRVLCEVPEGLGIDPSRKRRAHRKSKAGCDNCRKRRVKCNEESPCARCIKRGDRCQRGNLSVPPKMPAQNLLLSSCASPDDAVNLLHLKLFHHFQTSTCQTLFFEPDLWAQVFQLSFDFDFLMNAILCVAARHLAFLCPETPTYLASATSHLGRALSGFRLELSNELPSTHLDVFIATSMLLQFEIWTNVDFVSPGHENAVAADLAKDDIFTFSSSLKQVFLRSFSAESIHDSLFLSYFQNSPLDALVEAAQVSSETLAMYQDTFAYGRPLTLELLNIPLPYTRGKDLPNSDVWQHRAPDTQDSPDLIRDGYSPVITRLCLILSFLPEASPPDSVDSRSSVLMGLARYMHAFPVNCQSLFASMVHQSDPHALLLLYHFYRAVGILLSSGQFWWAHKRAAVFKRTLKGWLITQCT